MKLQMINSNFEKSDFLFDHIGGHLAENLHTEN